MKLLQEEYEARKKTWGGDRKSSAENLHLKNPKAPKLRAQMMKEHKIGAYEMETAVEVGRGIDRAAEVDPAFKREVLSGEVKAMNQPGRFFLPVLLVSAYIVWSLNALFEAKGRLAVIRCENSSGVFNADKLTAFQFNDPLG